MSDVDDARRDARLDRAHASIDPDDRPSPQELAEDQADWERWHRGWLRRHREDR